MDRRSWLWRRKSSEKSPGETESSVGSISSHSERFSDDQVYLNQNYQSVEVTLKNDIHQSEHNNHEVKTLSEKLSEALVSINAKEELVKQHVKVAEEAVSGWEKSESEVSGLKQQLEALTIKNSTLKDRVIHLDGALKECLRQLRQTREEKDQIAHEALEKKISETESSMDTEIYHKLEMIEKENSDLKLELSSMAEELEIRLIEKELSNQAAEEASKQYLDSVKKIAQLEAECHRLNLSTPKKARKPPFITENGGFGKFGRKRMDSSVEIGLMDDFLEMEKLAGMPENSEVEERIKKVENELKVSRNRLKEAESKLDERENELTVSRSRIEEVESKLVDLENELKASRNCLEECEYKLVESEKEVKEYRNRLEEAEFELGEYENELKASRNRVLESESKLNECQTELKASKNRLEEFESKLNDCENELKASRNRLEVYYESKLNDREKELEASRNQFKEAEFKLKEHENELKCAESELAKTDDRLEEAESRCKALETELEMLLSKVEYLENDVQKERDLSRKAEAKCRELENEVSRLKHEDEGTRSGNRAEELRLLKVKQEMELAVAGSKFAECKKTIDSLNRQLKTLATLDDFLIDITDS